MAAAAAVSGYRDPPPAPEFLHNIKYAFYLLSSHSILTELSARKSEVARTGAAATPALRTNNCLLTQNFSVNIHSLQPQIEVEHINVIMSERLSLLSFWPTVRYCELTAKTSLSAVAAR